MEIARQDFRNQPKFYVLLIIVSVTWSEQSLENMGLNMYKWYVFDLQFLPTLSMSSGSGRILIFSDPLIPQWHLNQANCVAFFFFGLIYSQISKFGPKSYPKQGPI